MKNTIIQTTRQTDINEDEPAKTESKKRSAIGAKNENILEFIMASEMHECDAIKIVMNMLKSESNISSLSDCDAGILNAFMNEGLQSDGSNTYESVMSHRQNKAYRLAITLGIFCEKKEEITMMSGTLMLFASSSKHVNGILDKLNSVKSERDGNAGKVHSAVVVQNDLFSSGNINSDTEQEDTKPSAF